jgi:hypothetical protein
MTEVRGHLADVIDRARREGTRRSSLDVASRKPS